MRMAFSALVAIWAIAGTLIFGICLIPAFLVVACIPKPRRYLFGAPLLQLWARFITRVLFLCRPLVEGREHLSKQEGVLLISNHRSWLDPILLMDLACGYGVSKKQIYYFPIVGQFAALSGIIFFDRRRPIERARVIPTAVERIQLGLNISLYPEGTRTRDGRLRKRVFLRLIEACYPAGISVLPIALLGTEDVLPVGKFQVGLLKRPRVTFLQPIAPDGYEDARTFAQACWKAVEEGVVALGGQAAES